MLEANKRYKEGLDSKKLFLLGMAIGIVSFIAIYGWKVIDIFYVDWIYQDINSDIAQSQIGFEFFYNASWRWPLGFYKSNFYPTGTSVMYTDSIPLFSVLLKLVRGILPNVPVQFQGLFGVVSFSLQGGFSAIIFKKFTNKNIVVFLGSILVVLNSVTLTRLYVHTALSAHFIILIVFAFWIYKDKFSSLFSRSLMWGGIMALAVMLHIYYVGMLGVLMFGFIIDDWREFKKINRGIIIIASSVSSVLLTMYILGGFKVNSGAASTGLGLYSMNLNSFLNSSFVGGTLIPSLPFRTGQEEGAMYLGAGIIFICCISCLLYIYLKLKNKLSLKYNGKISIYAVIFSVVALLFWASMPVITFGKNILIDLGQYEDFKKFWAVCTIILLIFMAIYIKKNKCKFSKTSYYKRYSLILLVILAVSCVILKTYSIWKPIVFDILSIFRASGRFGWPVFYLVIFGVIILLVKLCNNFKSTKLAPILLIGALVLQMLDFNNLIADASNRTPTDSVYQSRLVSSVWDDLAENIKHVEILSSQTNGIKHSQEVAEYAVHNGLTMGAGYFSRIDENLVEKKMNDAVFELQSGRIRKDTIYIISEDDLLSAYLDIPATKEIAIIYADGFNIIVSTRVLREIGYTGITNDDLVSNVNILANFSPNTGTYDNRLKEFSLWKKHFTVFGGVRLYPGVYTWKVEGENVDRLQFELRDIDDNSIPLTLKESTPEHVILEFDIFKIMQSPEFLINNDTGQTITIKNVAFSCDAN